MWNSGSCFLCIFIHVFLTDLKTLYIKDINILYFVNIKISNLKNIKNKMCLSVDMIFCLFVCFTLSEIQGAYSVNQQRCFFHIIYLCIYLFEKHLILICCLQKQSVIYTLNHWNPFFKYILFLILIFFFALSFPQFLN